MRRNNSVDWSAFGKYTTHILTDEACEVIANHDISSPLFLYMAHLAVHSANPYSPLQAPEETVDLFSSIEDLQRRRYAGCLYSHNTFSPFTHFTFSQLWCMSLTFRLAS